MKPFWCLAINHPCLTLIRFSAKRFDAVFFPLLSSVKRFCSPLNTYLVTGETYRTIPLRSSSGSERPEANRRRKTRCRYWKRYLTSNKGPWGSVCFVIKKGVFLERNRFNIIKIDLGLRIGFWGF